MPYTMTFKFTREENSRLNETDVKMIMFSPEVSNVGEA